MYILRERQQLAVERIDDFITNSDKNHGVFVYPTSFGKSLVIANLASKYPNKYFINVTSSKELLKQNYAKYASYGFGAEICSASLNSKNVGKVTFATITTLSKFADYFKDKEVVIIHDEAQEHSGIDSQIHKFIKKLKNYKLIGVTATPFRLSSGMEGSSLKMMNRDRGCIYKSLEDIVQISEVVEQGYWSKIVYDIKDMDETELVLNTTGADFTDLSIQKFKESNDLNNRIIEEINNLIKAGRKSILVSVPFIADAQEIASKLDCCEAIYSGMNPKDRDSIIEGFKTFKIKALIQCRILSVGFDFPELDALILARPTNSLTFFYQVIGRLVRIHPDKKDAIVVDLSGNCKKFGTIETISIENEKLTGGWAVFNGDTLLSNYPLNTTIRPTKKSLLAKIKWKERLKNNEESLSTTDVCFYFGKYNGKKISQVMKENKSYLTWLLDQKDFNWFGERGKNLKQGIEKYLGVFVDNVEVKDVKVESNFRNYEDLQKDLADVW